MYTCVRNMAVLVFSIKEDKIKAISRGNWALWLVGIKRKIMCTDQYNSDSSATDNTRIRFIRIHRNLQEAGARFFGKKTYKKEQLLNTSTTARRNLIEVRSENNRGRLDYESEGIKDGVRHKRVIEVFLIICRFSLYSGGRIALARYWIN
jgi:hypothetical protein